MTAMQIMTRATARFALCAALAAAGLRTPSARAAAPTEKSLPASTIFYLQVEDAAQFRRAFNASQIGQLLADPAMQPLKDDLKARIADTEAQVKEKLGVSLTQLLTLPQGRIAVALVGREGEKVPVALLASADAGTNADTMAGVLDKVEKEAQNGGAKASTEEHKGTTLHVLRDKDEAKKDAPPVVWARQGSVFLLATSVEALKDLLDHASGREESLASNENFAQVRKKVGQGAQALWFLDIAGAIRLVTQAGAAAGANAEQITAQLQLTGLNNLKAAGGSFAFGAGEFDAVGKVFVYAPGASQGVLKVFNTPKQDLRPQPWVPATVAAYQTFSWDLSAAFGAVNELADMFAPGLLDNALKGLAGANGEGIDVKKDVFGPLGKRITALSDIKKPITEKSQRALFAIALDDPRTFQATLTRVLGMVPLQPKKREFQGAAIYDFDLPPEAVKSGNIAGPISVTVAKDQLFIATDPTILEQVLRGGPSLADTPEYQAVARHFPSGMISQSFDRPEESVRMLYDALKSGRLQKAIDEAQEKAGKDAPKVKFDPAKVPDYAVISKYLSPGGSYGTTDEEGLLIVRFSTRKAQP